MSSGNWFLLKNRRHVGPYTAADIKVLWVEGQIKPDDYVIFSTDAQEGELKYRKIFEVFPELQAIGRALNLTPPVPTPLPESDRELRSFSDEDILKNEASRIFSEAFDSVDLTNASRVVFQEQGHRVVEKKRTPAHPVPRPAVDMDAQEISQSTSAPSGLKKRWVPVTVAVSLAGLIGWALTSSDSKKSGDQARSVASRSGGAEKVDGKSQAPSSAARPASARVVAEKFKPTIQVPKIDTPDPQPPLPRDSFAQEPPLPGYSIPEIEEMSADGSPSSHEGAPERPGRKKKKRPLKTETFQDDNGEGGGESETAEPTEESDGE